MRHKPDIIKKIKDLYSHHGQLVKHRSRSNDKVKQNRKEYSLKLDNLFDISHCNSNELIKNDEDREFLRLQQESRTGCLGSADNKTFLREKRSARRKERLLERATLSAAHCAEQQPEGGMPDDDSSPSSSSSDSEQSNDNDFTAALPTPSKRRCTDVISQKVAAVLDRTNTSIRTSTMIMASLVNEVGGSKSSAVI